MSFRDFITKLRKENVRLSVTGNDLTVSGDGQIDESLLRELKERKAETVEYLRKSKGSQSYEPIPVAESKKSYPLSFAQQRLWVHNEFVNDNSVYNMLSAIRLKGDLDIGAFRGAFSSLSLRHEVLRTSIRAVEGKPEQVILDEAPIELMYQDLVGHSDQEGIIDHIIKDSTSKKFDLGNPPLVLLHLLKLEEQEHIMLLNIHHLIADGWSINILLKDLIYFYESFREGKPMVELPQLKVQYKDYVQWQLELLNGDLGRELGEFWKNYLSGELPVLSIPYDHPRPVVRRDIGSTISVKIDDKLNTNLKELAKQQGVSLFMLMTSIAKTLFYRYSHQREVIIGTTTGGREHTDLEHVIGLFINAVPIRTVIDPDITFNDFLQKVRISTTKAFEHKAYPFDLIVKDLALERDPGRHPVFDVMVIMQNSEMNQKEFGAIEMSSIPIQKSISKFDLTFAFNEQSDGIGFSIEYNTDLFESETIDRMTQHFMALCRNIISSPGSTIEKLCFLSSDEEYQLKTAFNDTALEKPKYQTIAQLFEQAVEKSPTAVAVTYNGRSFTYQEVNEKANKLASYLDELEIGANDFVGLYLERGLALIVSMLGVMKSGAAFVPLDTGQQGDRLTYMMRDSGMELLIVQSHLTSNVNVSDLDLMIVDEEDVVTDWLEGYEVSNPTLQIVENRAAYVIYTSGSTGKPKGCIVSQGNILNYINWANRAFFEEEDSGNFGLFTSIGFDFTLTCILSPLTRGKQLHVFPSDQEITDILKEVFDPKNLIDAVKLTPSHVSLLNGIENTNIRTVVLGGEALKKAHLNRLDSISSNLRIINEYGPTEATVGCVAKTMTLDAPILIGSPIDNTSIFILDDKLQLVPIGVVGELCIAGAGVAIGYMNKESLTAEKFIDNPHKPGERLYRSGDKARWLASGEVEYLGRFDEQVKVRGHRIEPGEIEQQLISHDRVSEAVVVAKNDHAGNVFLDAYLHAEESLDVAQLRNFLSKGLPEFMIPAHFIVVDKIPLTSNGKVDRRALLELDSTSLSLGSEAEAPRNSIERLLVEIWQELLNSSEIGINDNFFHLGGDSIKAIQLSSKIQKCGLQVDLNMLFQYPTIKSLSAQVKGLRVEAPQGKIEGPVMLTPIQQEFFSANHPEPNHFNQSVMLFSKTNLVEEYVLTALNALCDHHDALRLRYDISKKAVEQWCDDNAEESFVLSTFDMETVDSPEKEILFEAEKIQQSLSIEKGPVLHCGIFHTSQGDYLLVVAHHLVIDGVSWRILLEDFVDIYRNLESGHSFELPSKTSSYQQWAAKLNSYASDSALLCQLDYWQKVVETPVLELPRNKVARENSLKITEVQSMHLTPEMTEKLVSQVHKAYDTQINDLLLTALALSINDWIGTSKVRVHLEGHGREDLFDELNLNRTIGWFTSLFPVLLPVEAPELLGDCIKGIKENLREVPDKGIGYGILSHLSSLDGSKMVSLHPEIVFNYLGQFDKDAGDGLFVRSDLSSGKNKSDSCFREQVLGINGSITNGALHLRFDYNILEFSETTITNFVSSFKDHLEAIIHHCLEITAQHPEVSSVEKEGSIEEENEIGIKLSNDKSEKVFAFPSLYGMAIGYASLANELNDVCMVAYDFLDDRRWRERYYESIKDYQPMGPYTFFGYSGGAILAYEMATFFESKGDTVSNLILIDQAPVLKTEVVSETALSNLADSMLDPSEEALRNNPYGKVLLEDPVLMKKVRNGIIAYKRLLSQSRTEGSIRSDIHLLSEESDCGRALEDKLSWNQFTSGSMNYIQGSGGHRQIFTPPHFQTNVEHIRKIMRQILTKEEVYQFQPTH